MKGVKIDATSAFLGVLVGVCAGGLGGYYLGRELSRRSAEERIQAETRTIQDHYRAKAEAARDRGDTGTGWPETAVGAARLDGPDADIVTGDTPAETSGLVPVSADAADDGERDETGTGGAEEPRRAVVTARSLPDKTKPYIISHDEFFEDDSDYRRSSLTWYALDKVLVDDREVPIREHAKLCGNFANRFGELSGDVNIVFIRNDKLRHDFEITLNQGSFADQVLGYGKPQ